MTTLPIPDFDENGFLPVGVYACILEEVEQRFGKFQRTSQRPELFAKLRDYVKEARNARIVKAIVLDGSFVTDKASPNDIDMIVVLPEDYDFRTKRPPFQYNVTSRSQARRRLKFDIVSVHENSAAYHKAVAFFQQDREREDVQKGVLRIEL
jgi:predicted nucleotidyltransferase